MTRVSKPPKIRKQEIIETALLLFSEKGYANTTIRDIADHMHIAQGLLYRYFPSKRDLFAATSDFYAGKAVEQMTKDIKGEGGPIEQLNSVIDNLLTYAMRHSEFEATYSQEKQIRSDRIQQLAVHITHQILPIVENGIREGLFSCEDVSSTVRFLTYGIIHMIHSEMPTKNAGEYILDCIPTIQDACAKMLGVDKKKITLLGRKDSA